MVRKRRGIPAAVILVLTVLACLTIWCCGIAAVIISPAEQPAPEVTAAPLPLLEMNIYAAPLPEAESAVPALADPYDESIPLDRELQATLREACEANGVPLSLALGLIEVESSFRVDAVSSENCYGLMQLNARYYPDDLTPQENIQAGAAHIARQIERYNGDVQAALTAYNAGYDTGSRTYARAVLDATEKWGAG